MSIGERLKRERERLGLTIPAFAEIAGAKKNTVIDWQNDKSSPPAEKLAALCERGLDVSYVLTGMTVEERQAALENRLDAIAETTRRSLELTQDLQKGELVRDILLADRWNKPEIIEAATERYVTVRMAQPSAESRVAERVAEYKIKPVKPTGKKSKGE